MIAEINAAIQSAKILGEVLKAAQGLKNYNEIVAAIYEVNSKLTNMTTVALEAQEKQLALSQRISELEKEIAELKDWQREAECYELAEVAVGVFTYRTKPGIKKNEPPHWLCTHCFTQRQKSTLQARGNGAYEYFHCKSFLYLPINSEDSSEWGKELRDFYGGEDS